MTSLRHSLNLKNGGVISLVGAGGKTSLMFRLARELSGQGVPVLSTTTTKIYIPGRNQSPAVMISSSARVLAAEARAMLRRNSHISAGSQLIPFRNKLNGLLPETIDALWQTGIFHWILVEADGAAGRPVKAPAAHEPVIPRSTRWVIGVVGLGAVGRPLTERWAFRLQQVSKITGLAPGESITESAISNLFVNAEGILKNVPAHALRFAFLNQADSSERLATGRRIAKMIESRKDTGITGVLIGQTLYDPPVSACYAKCRTV
jgi:probable selenium-dependent hydroxylase accessory protein YqeC